MADRCLLYYITDRSQFPGDERARRHALLAKVTEAARAGVDYIQLREKDLSARELETLARQAVAAVRENSPSTRLLINSRTDVALAAGVDGVHLRADDVAPHEVRQVLTLSAHRPLTTFSWPPPAILPPKSSAPNPRPPTSPSSLRCLRKRCLRRTTRNRRA